MIYDTNDNPLSAVEFTKLSEDQFQITIKIDCRENYRLYSDAVSDVLVEAKLSTDVSWTNIETGEILLGPLGPAIRSFDIRFTIGEVVDDISKIFSIRVTQ